MRSSPIEFELTTCMSVVARSIRAPDIIPSAVSASSTSSPLSRACCKRVDHLVEIGQTLGRDPQPHRLVEVGLAGTFGPTRRGPNQ